MVSAAKLPAATGYDYIFTGAGCASLSLLMRMTKSGKFSNKKILLIDKAPKIRNDRTWCFWEKNDGFFEDIVYKRWDHLEFSTDNATTTLDIRPYQYKMIRGIDFYEYCFAEINRQPNIEIIYGDVKEIIPGHKNKSINIDDRLLDGGDAILFNSIYRPPAPIHGKIYLLQHFKGWIIETPSPAFQPSKGILMDFRTGQEQGTSFVYLLPLSETKALVEYTLFTAKLLVAEQYNEGLKNYIRTRLAIDSYNVLEEEFGVIPMTNAKFEFYKEGVCHIGTAGGQTKASSGYTFRFIQKQSDQLIDCLLNNRPLQSIRRTPARFNFYDTVLLRLLEEGKLTGKEIFSKLFQRNKASLIFKFLDNETSFPEELSIISTLPTLPFLKASLK